MDYHSASSTPGLGVISSGNTRRRVKLYEMDASSEQDEWIDKGTGHVDCQHVERLNGICILVRSEVDGSILLASKISSEDVYLFQQETLIVWNVPDSDLNLALSFQEASGCKEIWENICEVQRILKTENSEDGSGFSLDGSTVLEVEETEPISTSAISIELPSVTMNNLENIRSIVLSYVNTASQREALSRAILNTDYVKKLIDVFHMVEDLEDIDNLHNLFTIFKTFVLLNDIALYELLFSDSIMVDLMGILEYDTEWPKRVKHREYLSNHVVFKEVVPFENEDLVKKIHQTFRLQYLKDVVLPRTLDDSTFATINSFIFFNNIDIVTCIQKDTRFLTKLFERIVFQIRKWQDNDRIPLPEPSTISDLRDSMSLLQEICNLSRNLQPTNRASFVQTLLFDYPLLKTITFTLCHLDPSIRLSSVSVLESVCIHDIVLLRSCMISADEKREKYPLFSKIIHAFMTDTEQGIRIQISEILYALLNLSNTGKAPENDEFLSVFYSDFLPDLLTAFEQDSSLEGLKESICDLISFCIQHHGYRIKYFLLGNHVMAKVLKLLQRPQKHLVLAAIRFFRSFVGLKDDFYNRHITKHFLFESLMEVFKENMFKYNLINSAILELLEFIRKENIKHLIQHLCENYGDLLGKVDYVETCRLLLLKHEQNQEPMPSDSAMSNSSMENTLERESEEAYFKESDDEDENLSNTNIDNEQQQQQQNGLSVNGQIEEKGSNAVHIKRLAENYESSLPTTATTTTTTTSSLAAGPATELRSLSEFVKERNLQRQETDHQITNQRTLQRSKKICIQLREQNVFLDSNRTQEQQHPLDKEEKKTSAMLKISNQSNDDDDDVTNGNLVNLHEPSGLVDHKHMNKSANSTDDDDDDDNDDDNTQRSYSKEKNSDMNRKKRRLSGPPF